MDAAQAITRLGGQEKGRELLEQGLLVLSQEGLLTEAPHYSRRQLLASGSLLAAPLIAAVLIPTPAHAASSSVSCGQIITITTSGTYDFVNPACGPNGTRLRIVVRGAGGGGGGASTDGVLGTSGASGNATTIQANSRPPGDTSTITAYLGGGGGGGFSGASGGLGGAGGAASGPAAVPGGMGGSGSGGSGGGGGGGGSTWIELFPGATDTVAGGTGGSGASLRVGAAGGVGGTAGSKGGAGAPGGAGGTGGGDGLPGQDAYVEVVYEAM